MKKFLLTILTIFLIGTAVHADGNVLHSVQIEGTTDGYNIILQTDSVPKVSKKIVSNDNVVINVKGLSASNSVKALYKGAASINSLVIENSDDNELKIYINASDIASATILAMASDGQQIILNEKFPTDKVLWTGVLLLMFIGIAKTMKSVVEYESSINIKKDIKEREIQLYKNFQKELAEMPKINCQINNTYASNVMRKSRRNYKELSRL